MKKGVPEAEKDSDQTNEEEIVSRPSKSGSYIHVYENAGKKSPRPVRHNSASSVSAVRDRLTIPVGGNSTSTSLPETKEVNVASEPQQETKSKRCTLF